MRTTESGTDATFFLSGFCGEIRYQLIWPSEWTSLCMNEMYLCDKAIHG